MLTIGGTTRVFLAIQPVDLHGSFNRLYGYAAEVLRADPQSGHWFVFTNNGVRFSESQTCVETAQVNHGGVFR
jgi:hypothetical protein